MLNIILTFFDDSKAILGSLCLWVITMNINYYHAILYNLCCSHFSDYFIVNEWEPSVALNYSAELVMGMMIILGRDGVSLQESTVRLVLTWECM